MEKGKIKSLLFLVARVILGLAFVFSGFVKAVDPLGFTYKINDYLEAFGMVYLTDLSFLMAVLQSAAEFILGAALLIGVWKKTVTLLLLIFMAFFTPLTLYIAIKNPVTDCGCFGDAVVLSNTMTFIKNLLLLALALLMFYRNELIQSPYGRTTGRWSMFWCIAFPLLLSTYSYLHLPLLDFRPYKVGNHLPDLMRIPEGAAVDSFQTVFIYEKDGVKQEFSADNVPLGNPDWTFVDRIETTIREGYKPKIHDFVLVHPVQGDITDQVLSDTSYTFLFISDKLEESNVNNMPSFMDAKVYALKHGYRFIGLTSSNPRGIEDWKYEFDPEMDFCSMDDRILKTMIRSNPGLMLLKGGTVLQKWSFRDIPDFLAKDKPLPETTWGKVNILQGAPVMGNLLFILLIPLAFFFLMHKGYRFHFFLPGKDKTSKD
jgi:uncharacterized membrane protein YphA (DoxX/SURF4 family)